MRGREPERGVNPNNQLQGYDYDAAGNMLRDNNGTKYVYDAENRIRSAPDFTYGYDADGNRVQKINGNTTPPTGTLYWYMSPGIVAESDLNGNLQSEYVFFGGERVARKDFPGKTVSYYFSDHLKTASVISDSAGKITSESDYYPWGGELQFVNGDSNHYKFTGKERDAETGLDYFGARHYSNGLGRFITPDWAAKATAVPYADFADPQSLNLYTYVRNIPTSKIDADGHLQQCATCPAPPVQPAAPPPAPAPPAPSVRPPIAPAPGISFTAVLTGIAVVFVPAMLFPDLLPGGTVGQSDNEERAQLEQDKREREKQNGGVDPQEPQTSTSGGGARQGGGDKQTGPGTTKDRSLQGTTQQVQDMERAQKNQSKTRRPIDSMEKSKQNLKHELKRVKSSEDVKEEQ